MKRRLGSVFSISILLFFVANAFYSNAQSTASKLLEESIDVIKEGRNLPSSADYNEKAKSYYSYAISKLETAARLDQKNAEICYFLGAAYDYYFTPSADAWVKSDLSWEYKASYEFEKAIKLQPNYEGRMINLSPYSKITSIWGTIACTKLYTNKRDSALWAFNEGVKRGGFTPYTLEHFRYQLSRLPGNCIYFVSGDLPFYASVYLQEVQNVRPDVVLVNWELIGVPWYTKALAKKHPALFGAGKYANDSDDMKKIDTTLVVQKVSADKSKKIDWKLPHLEHYYTHGMLCLKELLDNNLSEKKIRFSSLDTSSKNGLFAGCVYDGLTYNFFEDTTKSYVPMKTMLQQYPFGSLQKINAKDFDECLQFAIMVNESLLVLGDIIQNESEDAAKPFFKLFNDSLYTYQKLLNDKEIVGYIKKYRKQFKD